VASARAAVALTIDVVVRTAFDATFVTVAAASDVTCCTAAVACVTVASVSTAGAGLVLTTAGAGAEGAAVGGDTVGSSALATSANPPAHARAADRRAVRINQRCAAVRIASLVVPDTRRNMTPRRNKTSHFAGMRHL
jgi:hypothetical protein